ncbi:hypothetical protein MVEN_02362800 [Mycena venus]|uniref:Uncharacterized protein n=1 Tax=Mycena venus TaxID=2733690 RepID=A0A8H6X3R1_9AGAR|nr:hypothetical protein MVEN_02362800 [Mycena venus]
MTDAGADGAGLTRLVTEFFTFGFVQTELFSPNPETEVFTVDGVTKTVVTNTASSTSVLTRDQTIATKVVPITVDAAAADAGTTIFLTDFVTLNFGGASTITTVINGAPATQILPPKTIVDNEFAVTVEPTGAHSNSGTATAVATAPLETVFNESSRSASNEPTHSAGATQPAAGNTQVPVGAIVGAILGSMLLFSLGAAVLFLHRRRAHRRGNGPRSLGSRTESAFIDLSISEEEMKPRPLILYDTEGALETSKSTFLVSPTSELGASASTRSDDQGSAAAMPKAAEVALANMADEVQALRNQVRRLEQERVGYGARPMFVNESPPQYAPG